MLVKVKQCAKVTKKQNTDHLYFVCIHNLVKHMISKARHEKALNTSLHIGPGLPN